MTPQNPTGLRIVLCLGLLGLVGSHSLYAVAAQQQQAQTTMSQRPNILWIYLEDVSGWFSCYGDKLVKTPQIDGLAQQGIRFDRFYTPAGVCSATRSAIITGTMQTTFGIHNHRSSRRSFRGKDMGADYDAIRLPEGVKTLPELFREAGYFTFNESGKDDYNFLWDARSFYSPRKKGVPRNRPWRCSRPGQPFFGQLQLRGGKLGKRADRVIDRNAVEVPPYYPDIALVREEIGHHYDCILKTDGQVGQIIAALKEDGVFQNTLIVLLSDHGYRMHRHKQFLYEGGIHMPLIIAGPGILPGQVREDLVSGIDLAPTCLTAAGLPVPKFMEGGNVLAEESQPREFVIAARDRCDYSIDKIRAVVTPRFKYLRNYLTDRPYMQTSYKDPWPVTKKLRQMTQAGQLNAIQLQFYGPHRPAEELYDLRNDPHEIHNLASDPQYAEQLARHRQLLAGWIAKTGDQGQKPESPAGLLCVLRRWGDKCVNPEYDQVRSLIQAQKDLQPE